MLGTLAALMGLTLQHRVRHTREKLLSQFAASFRQGYLRLELLLGAGWPFYILAVGGGLLLVGDMVFTSLLSKGRIEKVMSNLDGRKKRRVAPAFWQNLQDYRVSYGAPLLDATESRRVDGNGFQLPVAASTG